MLETLNDKVVLIGTAHVSATSVKTVEDEIRRLRPAKVLVELDERRLEALQNPEAWRNMDIFKVIKEKKQHLFLLQLYLGSMQARMGRETGVAPGADMLAAVQVADEVGAEVVLIDRDIRMTLKRGFGAMGFWARARLFWKIWQTTFSPGGEEVDPIDVEQMLDSDVITMMTEEFAEFAPVIKEALIDERDAYMAAHIKEQAATLPVTPVAAAEPVIGEGLTVETAVAQSHEGGIVAVVGAGHMPGIKRHFDAPEIKPTRDELNEPPPWRFTVTRLLGYAVPAIMIAIFAGLALAGRFNDLLDSLSQWVIINGALAALGAILARGHILSAVTAFVAAPLTSLSPALAAGWFAGLVEAKIHAPKVSDFEEIRKIETMKEFYKNNVVRILLVAAFANLGSIAGTWVAGWRIVEIVGAG